MNLLCIAAQIAARVTEIYNQVESNNRNIIKLSRRVDSLENQLQTGLTIIPEFSNFFNDRIGQNVQISMMFYKIEGVVVSTADDGVQIREASGDIVLIPFSKITSVQ